MTQDEIIRMAREAGCHASVITGAICFNPGVLERFAALVAAHEREKQSEQEPVPTGATHYQPHQKTYYKRVSATEWYLWSCTGKGWLPSKGTSDSSEWIMLSPIQAHQPAKPAEQEPVATHICNLWVDPITKEYVVDHCDHPIDELIPAYAAPVQQAEQEPVAWRVRGYNQFKTGNPAPWRYVDGTDKPTVNIPDCCDFEPLYAALVAAPVRTKDLTDVEVEKVWRKHGGYMVMPIDFARAVIAADRLKNNITTPPCWCHKCNEDRFVNGIPYNLTRMILCPECGNKRCPHAADHGLACTNSNKPGQPGSVY